MAEYTRKQILELLCALSTLYSIPVDQFKLTDEAAMVAHDLIKNTSNIRIKLANKYWENIAKYVKPHFVAEGSFIVMPGEIHISLFDPDTGEYSSVGQLTALSLESLAQAYKELSAYPRRSVECINYINLIQTRFTYLAQEEERRLNNAGRVMAEDALSLIMQINMNGLFTDAKQVMIPYRDAGNYNWIVNIDGTAKTIELYDRDNLDRNGEVKVYTIKYELQYKRPVGLK